MLLPIGDITTGIVSPVIPFAISRSTSGRKYPSRPILSSPPLPPPQQRNERAQGQHVAGRRRGRTGDGRCTQRHLSGYLHRPRPRVEPARPEAVAAHPWRPQTVRCLYRPLRGGRHRLAVESRGAQMSAQLAGLAPRTARCRRRRTRREQRSTSTRGRAGCTSYVH